MREVMPLFKRANVLGEIAWDDDPYSAPRSTLKDRSKTTDLKIVPLKMAFVVRGSFGLPDPEQRLIELVSPNGRHSITLRFLPSPPPARA